MYDNRYMTQVSKRKLDSKIEKELLDSLSYIIKELKTKEDVDKFLSSSLTKTERLMIAKRVLTAFLLQNNIEDQRISVTLKLTPATITRLKMWIKLNKDGFDLVFKKLAKKDKEDIAKQILYKFLNYAVKAAFGRVPKPF
ncbi:MAG: Trp family transcriptional regulator [Candidatus Woesebacteria bacterium]|nr:Trp family transcriptional regulator [Candidatus Woesebacteria bacterium]